MEMSYHITILRTQGGQKEGISLPEVKTAVASMPDLRIKSTAGGHLEISTFTHDNQEALLVWKEGEIWTRNPERDTLQIMLKLAEKLNARVRGDEWETYRTPEESYRHQDDLAAIQVAYQEAKQFIGMIKRKRWLVSGAIIGGFIILGLVVGYFSR